MALSLPLDLSTREIPLFGLLDKLHPETLNLITATYGNCPAWFIKTAFSAMASMHHALDKYIVLYRNKEKEGYSEMFALFERWMNSDVPLAGQIFQELIDDVFQQKPPRGKPLASREQDSGPQADYLSCARHYLGNTMTLCIPHTAGRCPS